LPQGTARPYYANYGKGIIWWETDARAQAFLNGGYTISSQTTRISARTMMCALITRAILASSEPVQLIPRTDVPALRPTNATDRRTTA
jgi:hypothetical protein